MQLGGRDEPCQTATALNHEKTRRTRNRRTRGLPFFRAVSCLFVVPLVAVSFHQGRAATGGRGEPRACRPNGRHLDCDSQTEPQCRMSKKVTLAEQALPDLHEFIPEELRGAALSQSLIPSIAKDPRLIAALENGAQRIPTRHDLHAVDARAIDFIAAGSVHLVVTSPPYWTLKAYREDEGQLGHVADYEGFLDQLDRVWRLCMDALVPGGRLVCVVGDVCLSRRKNGGVHAVVPLHASIQERCRKLGFTNLAPIVWHKIANAVYEASGNGSGFLGKPYEPNAVIKNDIEYILMQRKPGGYRAPSAEARLLSAISSVNHAIWFQQIWTGLTGASTKHHPAPFPLGVAERLVRMFSFAGDTVLDPFMGTGTTNLACARWGRNSIGLEVGPEYYAYAVRRLQAETQGLFSSAVIVPHPKGSHDRI